MAFTFTTTISRASSDHPTTKTMPPPLNGRLPPNNSPTPTKKPPTKSDQILQSLITHHPLQRLPSPSRKSSLALHTLSLSSFLYSFHYLHSHPNPISSSYGWHFQYLTIIGLLLATLTTLTAVAADLTLSRRLFLLKNSLAICSAPLEVLISLLYWGLRAINPTLVVPKGLDLPLSADLSFHFIPSLVLVVDLLFFSPPWAITALPSLLLSTTIAFAYWFWVELCFSRNGFYPYPIFGMLGTGARTGLFAGSAVVMAGSTAGLKWVYGRVNGVGEESVGDVR